MARSINTRMQVTDYLLKRGFNRTEEVFRQESKHLGPDGKPIQQLSNIGPKKYLKAFRLLKDWVDNNLEIYKVRITDLLYPSTPQTDTSCYSLSFPSSFGPSSRILSLSSPPPAIPKMRKPSLKNWAPASSLHTLMISRHLRPYHCRSTLQKTPPQNSIKTTSTAFHSTSTLLATFSTFWRGIGSKAVLSFVNSLLLTVRLTRQHVARLPPSALRPCLGGPRTRTSMMWTAKRVSQGSILASRTKTFWIQLRLCS